MNHHLVFALTVGVPLFFAGYMIGNIRGYKEGIKIGNAMCEELTEFAKTKLLELIEFK